MGYSAAVIGLWRARGVASLLLVVLVLFVPPSVMSCMPGVRVYEADSASEENQMREYKASARQVVEAALGALVERDEYDSAAAERQKQATLKALGAAGTDTISTRSVDQSEAQLKALVPAEQHAYISARGGRYVVDVALTVLDASTIRVELIPHLIATAGGGPLGGRPLPSNGTLEEALFDALEARLDG